MAGRTLEVPNSEGLLRALRLTAQEFEAEARLLLAVKLYEMGRLTTGRGAELAGLERVEFMLALGRFGLSPIGVDLEKLEEDLGHA